MRTNLFIYFILIVILVTGCSLIRTPIGGTYHNVTAHYNAYFIANERMVEIENMLYDGYDWNYNKILPIYIPIDSNDANSMETQIEDCIKKSSIAIQRHPNSRWEDDSYILVGKSRYYAIEYSDAIETFKYVNKNSEDDDSRHKALIELIKTFVDFNEINNAIAVSDYLKKEELNRTNQIELSLVRAHLYQKRVDLELQVQNLVKAEDLMKKNDDRARINFIIGQIYQALNQESEAYKYYSKCLKNSPIYELEFYAKLNMAQVTELANNSDVKKTRKYFKKLLKDPKNTEFKDKIYYEMASFELKQGNLDLAIDFFKKSIKSSVNNQRQKAYSYLKLGQIYYDSLKNFEMAKNYYDSTVQVMPKDEEEYEKIKQRQEILKDFVDQLTIIRTNDSLISLSQLPPDSLLSLATSVAKAKAAAEKERKKAEANKQARQTTAFDREGGDLIGTNMAPGAIWYFNNPSLVSKGIADFQRVWGNRPLEDNWRRSVKTDRQIATEEDQTNEEDVPKITDSDSSEDENLQASIDEMLANVPSTEDDINKLLAEVEVALYKLGNIYNFNLEEKLNAVKSFETLLVRFNETAYKPEVLYQLYLLYKKIDNEIAIVKGNELKQQFPESIYAKLVDNPNYREESFAASEQLKATYTIAYKLFQQGKYEESSYLLDSALSVYPDNVFSDNVALLNVLNIGKMNGQIKYQYELNNFIKSYPESEKIEYAQKLLKHSEEYQINLYNSAKARFIPYFEQKHYLAVVYPNNEELSTLITKEVDDYLKNNETPLTSGNLVIDEANAVILINQFDNRSQSSSFLKKFNDELNLKVLHMGEEIHCFTISKDNFDILYQTKDISAYLNFFDLNY